MKATTGALLSLALFGSTSLAQTPAQAPTKPAAQHPAQPTPQPTAQAEKPDFKAELEKLVKDFDAAQDAYYEPLRAAQTDEEREKAQLDPEKEPTHLFVPRFQDLARRAKGTESAVGAHLWIVGHSRMPGSQDSAASLDALLSEYVSSPRLVDLASQLRYGSWVVGEERAVGALEKLSTVSPHEDVRAASLYVLGCVKIAGDSAGEDRRKDARALFERVQREHPKTRWARQAEGDLFELDHLQVGMVAPDFEATDEGGARYKLSDYRGKVVVLDFWGFW